VKKDLFSQKIDVPATFLESFNAQSGAGIQRDEKDDPPVVVVPPAK